MVLASIWASSKVVSESELMGKILSLQLKNNYLNLILRLNDTIMTRDKKN